VRKNLRSLNRKLERSWHRRRLTIVGGDFNNVPDRRKKSGGRDVIAAGTEADPECWYRTFTRFRSNRLSTKRTEGNRDCTDDRFFTRGADSYYDTVWLAARRNRPRAICRAWTYNRRLRATRGNSCTDTNSDGLRDRERIDYIWVRWENRRGKPQSPSRSQASALVGKADADRVCVDNDCRNTRYSDHRAAFTEIR
jgi:hypothetical protein